MRDVYHICQNILCKFWWRSFSVGGPSFLGVFGRTPAAPLAHHLLLSLPLHVACCWYRCVMLMKVFIDFDHREGARKPICSSAAPLGGAGAFSILQKMQSVPLACISLTPHSWRSLWDKEQSQGHSPPPHVKVTLTSWPQLVADSSVSLVFTLKSLQCSASGLRITWCSPNWLKVSTLVGAGSPRLSAGDFRVFSKSVFWQSFGIGVGFRSPLYASVSPKISWRAGAYADELYIMV